MINNLLFVIILSFLRYINTLPNEHEEIVPGIGGIKILPIPKNNTIITRKIQRYGPSFNIRVPENMYYRPRLHKITNQQNDTNFITEIKSKIITNNINDNKNIIIPPSAKSTNNIDEKQLTLKEIAIVTCKKIDVYRKMYNVNDIKNFAHQNCFLIQIYYPDISCHDIKEIVDYCVEKNFFKE